ncbi:hypothetical protein GCM10017786_64460 [Amycolatopsis deserti]|uniref:Uncharacterized protein n=1 Tax=Amycolatopsis deserti TaxID=185696 RepID=A0ABQ3JDG0_9PSEU|nr:hypothetical protein [Amycolatopsis deserti]GHF21536.1 hypothetical protein GCM10017786_64460 [Amycolatopsis deserti]
MGSLNDYGPKIVTLDTGGIAHGLDTTVEIAERAGIAVDYANPGEINGRPVYPVVADRVSMGRAVGHDVRGSASAGPVEGAPGPGQSAMVDTPPPGGVKSTRYDNVVVGSGQGVAARHDERCRPPGRR